MGNGETTGTRLSKGNKGRACQVTLRASRSRISATQNWTISSWSGWSSLPSRPCTSSPQSCRNRRPSSSLFFSTSRVRARVRCREHPPLHTHLSVPYSKPRTCPPRHKLRYHVKNLRSLLDLFPWKNKVTTTTADSCKSFSLSLSQTVTECGRVHVSVETNSNKRISALGTTMWDFHIALRILQGVLINKISTL